jgi:hypothetical protein
MLTAALTLALLAPQDPQVVDGVIVRPQWVQTPTAAQAPSPVVTEFPTNGEVRLLCAIQQNGGLTDCVVELVVPRDYRLEAHALALSRHYRHALRLADGRSAVGMKVRVKIRWVTPD